MLNGEFGDTFKLISWK